VTAGCTAAVSSPLDAFASLVRHYPAAPDGEVSGVSRELVVSFQNAGKKL
jgi:hypothetical protein